MRKRWTRLSGLVTVIGIFLLPVPVPGQATPEASAPLRTPWGDPDLRGVWDFRTITPLERPKELSGKDILNDQEAAEFATQTLKQRN